VALNTRWEGIAPDPFSDASHLAFEARGRVTLTEFGLGQELMPGLLVPGLGDAVDLLLDVVLLPYDPAPKLADIPID
jgi:hypothetical protein